MFLEKIKEMRKEIFSEFHQFVTDQVGYFQAKHLHLEMELPAHPVTKAYKSPENTPHKVLIAFSEILKIHPFELIRDYNVGTQRISDIEQAYHEKEYHTILKLQTTN